MADTAGDAVRREPVIETAAGRGQVIAAAVRAAKSDTFGWFFFAAVSAAVGVAGLAGAAHMWMSGDSFGMTALIAFAGSSFAALGAFIGYIAVDGRGLPRRLELVLVERPNTIRLVQSRWVATKLEGLVEVRRDLSVLIVCQDGARFSVTLNKDDGPAYVALLREIAAEARFDPP